MRKWPNTDHWQRIEIALRQRYGASWRRRGEGLLGLPRGALRAAVDRIDVDQEWLATVEDAIAAELRAEAAHAMQYASTLAQLADGAEGRSSDIRFKLRLAELEADQRDVDEIIADYADSEGLTFCDRSGRVTDYRGNVIEEAA